MSPSSWIVRSVIFGPRYLCMAASCYQIWRKYLHWQQRYGWNPNPTWQPDILNFTEGLIWADQQSCNLHLHFKLNVNTFVGDRTIAEKTNCRKNKSMMAANIVLSLVKGVIFGDLPGSRLSIFNIYLLTKFDGTTFTDNRDVAENTAAILDKMAATAILHFCYSPF